MCGSPQAQGVCPGPVEGGQTRRFLPATCPQNVPKQPIAVTDRKSRCSRPEALFVVLRGRQKHPNLFRFNFSAMKGSVPGDPDLSLFSTHREAGVHGPKTLVLPWSEPQSAPSDPISSRGPDQRTRVGCAYLNVNPLKLSRVSFKCSAQLIDRPAHVTLVRPRKNHCKRALERVQYLNRLDLEAEPLGNGSGLRGDVRIARRQSPAGWWALRWSSVPYSPLSMAACSPVSTAVLSSAMDSSER
jgi:hypothetical protein